jgi:predicted DsbA family dithiol-disulfide isomerase
VVEAEPIRLEIFFDYLCPFVYRAAELIEKVGTVGRRHVEVRWRYFSLTQVNSKDDGWTVWEAPASEPVRGRLAFQAGEAAKRQDAFAAMHWRLLRARHRDRLDLDDTSVVEKLAVEAELDMERFHRDVVDPSTLAALASDHQAGVTEHGVFGTPTFVFADGAAAYVRLSPAVLEGNAALETFDRLIDVAAAEPRILEIKRPFRR